MSGGRQGHALSRQFGGKKCVGDLKQNAGPVARERVATRGSAMREVLENVETVRDDGMRFMAFDVGDKADAAGIVFELRVIEAVRSRLLSRFWISRYGFSPGPKRGVRLSQALRRDSAALRRGNETRLLLAYQAQKMQADRESRFHSGPSHFAVNRAYRVAHAEDARQVIPGKFQHKPLPRAEICPPSV